MKLVFFHRYLGEEDDGGSLQKSRSQALLEKLQQKARERQSQSSTVRRQISTEEVTKQKNAQKKQKPEKSTSQEPAPAKKSKLEEVPCPVLDSVNIEDGIKEEKSKKKKKKQSLSGL